MFGACRVLTARFGPCRAGISLGCRRFWSTAHCPSRVPTPFGPSPYAEFRDPLGFKHRLLCHVPLEVQFP